MPASHALYIGMTNNLFARVMEHRADKAGSYTAKYRITRLVYVEKFKYVNDAIAREKQLKDWRRERKDELIVADNPTSEDLAATWDEWAERVHRQAHGCPWLSLYRRGHRWSLEQQIPPLRWGMTVFQMEST